MESFIQRLNNPWIVYMPDMYKQQKWTSDGAICFSSLSQSTFQKIMPLFMITEGLARLKTWKLAACKGGGFVWPTRKWVEKPGKRAYLSLFRPFLLAAHLRAWQTSYEAGSKAEPNWTVWS